MLVYTRPRHLDLQKVALTQELPRLQRGRIGHGGGGGLNFFVIQLWGHYGRVSFQVRAISRRLGGPRESRRRRRHRRSNRRLAQRNSSSIRTSLHGRKQPGTDGYRRPNS